MKGKLSFVIIVLFLFVFASCKTTSKLVEEKTHSSTDCTHVHWSDEEGEDGPSHWKSLCTGFSACGGKIQSPIDIQTKTVNKGTQLHSAKFAYGQSKVNIVNNGHTIQFNVTGDHHVNLNGKDYKLLQFHYHSLSEHTIDGKHFPIEVHFVHKHSDTDFAVLSMLYKEGEANELFNQYMAQFPVSEGEYNSKDEFNVLSILPADRSYYYYKGSLTTPPCSEVVNWYVLKTPLTASTEQIEKFSELLHHNYRPIQALNGRTVKEFGE